MRDDGARGCETRKRREWIRGAKTAMAMWTQSETTARVDAMREDDASRREAPRPCAQWTQRRDDAARWTQCEKTARVDARRHAPARGSDARRDDVR